MPCRKIAFLPVFILAFLLTLTPALAQTYVFARLNGSPINTAGWNLQGGAMVGNVTMTGDQELIVCPRNSASGAVFFNQPINLSLCNKWKAEFDFRMHDGSGADGLTFCFLDVPPVGFVTGGGLGVPKNANGLKVCFDTWNNCIPFTAGTVHLNMPKIEIRYGNGYDECSSQPTFMNVNGQLNFLTSAEYHRAKIEYNNGKIDVYVDSTLYLSGTQTFDFTGYLGFTASTGGYNDNHSIKNVVIYTEMPPSVAGNDAAICPNEAVNLGSSPTPGYVYTWTGPAGLNATNIANPVLRPNNNSSDIIKATYMVKTAFANNPGCASQDSVTIKVYPQPKVQFKTPAICLNDAFAAFTDSSYTNDLASLPFSYRWRFGDGNASASNPDTSALQNPVHRYSAANNYTIQLKVTSKQGCTDSLAKVFTVNGDFPRAAFLLSSPAEQCSNKPFNIQNTSSVNFGSITRAEIQWDAANQPANVWVDSFPVVPGNYSYTYPVIRGNQPKTFKVLLKVFSGKSCLDTISKNIVINPLPSPQIISPLPVCEDAAPFQIIAVSDTAGKPGHGFYIGQGIDSIGTFNASSAGSGQHPLSYVFITNKGCTDTALSAVQVWPLPKISLPPRFLILEKGSAPLMAEATGQQLQFLWSPAIYLSNARLLQPVCAPLTDTRYTLTATGIGGCLSSQSTQVTVLKRPVIPNAFSPNHDGINDHWNIQSLVTYPACKVDVFDRYGRPIFHSVGYSQPWDGTFKGNDLPVGTYYYVIDVGFGLSIFSGFVVILR